MSQCFFSILVPVYNAEKYLNECLTSLMSQTFRDYEVVIIDDGSTDGSAEICDSWQIKGPQRIRVIHRENRGVFSTREQLLREAQGQYIVFVDADDVISVRALEILRGCIAQTNADVVVYSHSPKPDFTNPHIVPSLRKNVPLSIPEDPELCRLMGSAFRLNALCIKTFRRELFPWDLDWNSLFHIRQGEDLIISLYIMDRAERIVCIDDVIYYYRTNPAGITHSYDDSLFLSLRDTLRVQRSFAEKWDPTGKLARECDVNGLFRFADDVIVRIMNADIPLAEKRKHMSQMIKDTDFLRDYQYIREISSAKARLSLICARYNFMFPLEIYSALKKKLRRR